MDQQQRQGNNGQPNAPSQQNSQMRQQQQTNDKIFVKFNFPQVSKYVKFEFQRKFSLIELRPTFQKILDIDLYGRQLNFKLIPKDAEQRTLDEIKSIADQGLSDKEYEICVSLQDYGA